MVRVFAADAATELRPGMPDLSFMTDVPYYS